MKKVNNIFTTFLFIFIAGFFIFVVSPVSASPYGVGVYDAVVPYGGQTSLTISASNVAISAQAASGGQLSTSSNAVTVTSTDVKGYKLYLNALTSANLTGTVGSIPASANVSLAALATNFIGVTTTPTLITNFTGPSAPSTGGSVTTVTYGLKLDFLKAAGNYTTNILYTAVPQTT